MEIKDSRSDCPITEAEYYAAIDACKAGMHIQVILHEIQFGKISTDDSIGPLKMLLDNQSTIHQLATHQIRTSSKHIQVRYYWLLDACARNRVEADYISTENNLADMHTKLHSHVKLRQLSAEMGVQTREEFKNGRSSCKSSRECVEEGDLMEQDDAQNLHLMILLSECCK